MIKQNLLKINNLFAHVGDKQILNGVSLEISKGEKVIIFGPNGSGKTSLLKLILGVGGIKIQSGEILFKNKILNNLDINRRAELGISMMFQKPPKISGIKLSSLLNILNLDINFIENKVKNLNCSKFANRELNDNLSGGETKRSELVQLACQKSDLFLFDEPDSGVDVDNIKLIGKEINELTNKEGKSAIIITHNGNILDYIKADTAYILIDGRIVCQSSPSIIWKLIKKNGYKKCLGCLGKKYEH
jgi:Fe-S cluster assembly ATP-binding protein